MQTQDGRESEGLVKAEFQDVMRYLIVPLIQKDVQRRVDTNAPTFSGKPMGDIVHEWRQKLQGAYHCLKQQQWICECPSQEQVKHAEDNAQKKGAAAKEAESDAHKAPQKVAAAKDALMKAEHQLAEAQSTQSGRCTTTDYSQALIGVWAAKVALDKAGEDARSAEPHARAARAAADQAELELQEIFNAWRPSRVPFLLSMDNCRSYSFYEGSSKARIVPVVPLLQVNVTDSMS